MLRVSLSGAHRGVPLAAAIVAIAQGTPQLALSTYCTATTAIATSGTAIAAAETHRKPAPQTPTTFGALTHFLGFG